jgi:ribonuclease BN (tRNA processing enzyme)
MNSVWKNAKMVAMQAKGLILTHQAGRYAEQEGPSDESQFPRIEPGVTFSF